MDDSSEKRTGLIVVLILIAVVIAGAWYFFQRPGAREAVDETVGVFVPDAEEMDRRMGYVDEARQLRDMINARQSQDLE